MTAYTMGEKRRQRQERQKRSAPVARSGAQEVIRQQALTTRALIEPENLRWFVLQVESTHEEQVIRSLDMRSIPAAIPTVPKERIRRGKVYRWRSPIAHGYVLLGFPNIGAIDWWDILNINYVWNVIPDRSTGRAAQMPWRTSYTEQGVIRKGGVEVLLPDLEAVRTGAARYVRAHKFAAGDAVRVEAGPFTGFEGKVQQMDGASARLLLNILGRQTPVQMSAEDVVKAA
jgi:transcription antitermination factor NusG